MVAARVDPPAAEPDRDAGDRPAVLARLDARVERAQAVVHRLDPVGLLHAQLARAADDRLPARVRGEQRDERQLVDERRHFLRRDLRRDELARLHLHRRDRLAADAVAVEDRDAGAHPLEHVEQAGAARVDAEARGS